MYIHIKSLLWQRSARSCFPLCIGDRDLSRCKVSCASSPLCVSQDLQEEDTQLWGRVSVCVVSDGDGTKLRAQTDLRLLAGAGLAALLSVEPVVTDAVPRDQVAPVEVIDAALICRQKRIV